MDNADNLNGIIGRNGAEGAPGGKAREESERWIEEGTGELARLNKELQAEINERKRLEETLQEEKNKLKSMVDAMEYGLTIQDKDFNIIYQNKPQEDTFGGRGGKCYRVYEGKDKICDGCPLEMAFGDGKSHTSERKVVMPSGKIVYFENTANPIRNAKGEIVTCLEIARDITERKRAEEALERYARDAEMAKANIENIIKSMIDALIIVTPEGSIKSANRSALYLLGYEEHDLIGQPVGVLFSEGDLFSDEEFKPEIERGTVTVHDATLSTKSGKKIPASLSASVLKDREGKLEGSVIIARDMRESRLVKELEKANRELKDTTMQLVQSEKLLALGELTAGVAHELNQPLNVIKIISQSLMKDIEKNRFDTNELGNDLKETVDQVNKMSEIIEHMRIYSRKSERTSEEIVNVNLLIEGPFKLLDQQLRNYKIEVVKELDPDLPKVVGDPILLEQVFMNLITNARNALDDCGKDDKKMVIRAYNLEGQSQGGVQSSVVVEVRDNGDGIPEHLREKIFQPFFTTREPGQGKGLGLSVANKIVQEHKGRIELESATGEGTTFRVILPVAQKAAGRFSRPIKIH